MDSFSLEVGPQEPVLHPCWNFDWLDAVHITPAAVSSWVQKPWPEDSILQHFFPSSGSCCFLSSAMPPWPWNQGADGDVPFRTEPPTATPGLSLCINCCHCREVSQVKAVMVDWIKKINSEGTEGQPREESLFLPVSPRR